MAIQSVIVAPVDIPKRAWHITSSVVMAALPSAKAAHAHPGLWALLYLHCYFKPWVKLAQITSTHAIIPPLMAVQTHPQRGLSCCLSTALGRDARESVGAMFPWILAFVLHTSPWYLSTYDVASPQPQRGIEGLLEVPCFRPEQKSRACPKLCSPPQLQCVGSVPGRASCTVTNQRAGSSGPEKLRRIVS